MFFFSSESHVLLYEHVIENLESPWKMIIVTKFISVVLKIVKTVNPAKNLSL